LLAARLRVVALLEAGRIPAMTETLVKAAADVDSVMTTAAQLDLASLHIAVDLLLGRLASAASALRAARAQCQELAITSDEPFNRQLVVLLWHQGDSEGLRKLARGHKGEPDGAGELALLALAAAEAGALAECREHLDELVARPSWPAQATNRPALDVMSALAVAANRSGHRAVAKVTLKSLLAQRSSLVVAPKAEVLLGPASYFAGLSAATTGKSKLARELLAGSEEHSRAIGAQPCLVRTLAARAELAAAEHDLDDVEQFTAEAKSLASTMGMGWFDAWPGPGPAR
jgi:hypothetical protein